MGDADIGKASSETSASIRYIKPWTLGCSVFNLSSLVAILVAGSLKLVAEAA